MAVEQMSTEELLQKLVDGGIKITQEEEKKFKEYEVDGETVHCGLTDHMVSQLFPGSFKKQAKFISLIRQMELDTVQKVNLSVDSQASPVLQESHVPVSSKEQFPSVFEMPKFPKDLQKRLENKEPCHKNSTDRHKIIRVLQEAMAQYTLYPSNCDYVNVAKALILKFPFLRDVEGNGYHTWHMSLKRKFKTERAPLVSDEEVKKFKERFGHGVKGPKQPETSCQRIDSPLDPQPDAVGEDSISVDAHVKILQEQYQRTQPDTAVVNERMTRTFHWRRREIMHGMMTAQAIEKYPFLRTAMGLYQEVGRIHKVANLNQRFHENFSEMVPSLLKLLRGKSTIEKVYVDSRGEALVEDTTGIDFKAALILLPTVFREKLDKRNLPRHIPLFNYWIPLTGRRSSVRRGMLL
ncbi:sterile alpha motif domain-containing protein 3-like isoform X2 [Brachyhypopomus gauderio]|uniref:sterile alpha motif domain-containing protein 3-like isoform X2 n=1 Tax=Brachyhypopomus gauderio TaxID=698409 RepID=UPI0040415B8B